MAKEPKKKTTARAAPKKTPDRAATVQVAARLTLEEKSDLDVIVQAHDDAASAQSFQGGGFNGWLRAVIREKKTKSTAR